LAIEGLSLDFATARGRVRAIRDVSFSVPANRIVGIVGESGSGKSTVAAAALGFLAQNAMVRDGTVRVAGRDVLSLSHRELRNLRGRDVAMIFQDPMTALNPVLTLGTQMCHIQHRSSELSRRQKLDRAEAMLARVGIADARARLGDYPGALSGGMRQRVVIAMALLARPALLIADEPTTALDATTEAQIVALLRDLQRETGCAVLFISHSLGLLSDLCDTIIVMYAGRVVESGPVTEVLAAPRHPYTRALIATDPACLTHTSRILPTIPGEVPDLLTPFPGCVFATRCARVMPRCLSEDPQLRFLVQPAVTVCCHAISEDDA
jgi:oligopeptide/dipeptide ABC transporter ATP-binding protein